jgi:hypothetical protein
MKNCEGGIVGYNVQMAVDAEHHLIVAHEVTHDGLDRDPLSRMAETAKGSIGKDELTVVADRGYFKSEEILECTRCGIAPIVPKSLTSNNLAEGRFDKQDFIDLAEDDCRISSDRTHPISWDGDHPISSVGDHRQRVV